MVFCDPACASFNNIGPSTATANVNRACSVSWNRIPSGFAATGAGATLGELGVEATAVTLVADSSGAVAPVAGGEEAARGGATRAGGLCGGVALAASTLGRSRLGADCTSTTWP